MTVISKIKVSIALQRKASTSTNTKSTTLILKCLVCFLRSVIATHFKRRAAKISCLTEQIILNMSKTVKEEVSDISPALFLDPSGQPVRFYLRPGPTKVQLFPLVTKGGGTLCRNQEPEAVLLVDPKDASSAVTSSGQTYYSIQYIKDCVEHNQLFNIDEYIVKIGPSVQTRMASRHQGNGRLGYTQEDDAAILKFMEKRQNEAKGNRVWQDMEKQSITAHSWQSMRNRFLKYLQYKLVEKSPAKCPSVSSKRKALSFIDSSSSKENVSQTSSKADSSQKSPRKSVVVSDSAGDQMATENSLCPTVVVSNPQPSPERASSPPDVAEAVEKTPQSSSDTGQKSCHQIQEQETMNEEEQTQIRLMSESPETSKRQRLDGEQDEQNCTDGNISQPSFSETRQTTCQTSTPASKKLGILARAAKEFEDSDVMDEESIEDENPGEAPLEKPSDTHESSAAPAREPESHTEDLNDARQGASEAPSNEIIQIHDDERPGPSGSALPVTSTAHEFIFESQEEDDSQTIPEETLSSSLTDIKQHIIDLMRETKKDLVEVTKALLKASGDLAKAQVYLLEGYDYETHGPLWTSQDDKILLLDDPYELEQLQLKYGEDDVSRRRAFLNADLH